MVVGEASDWNPPPPPPPAPSYPPGQRKGGGSVYDALSQFFLVLILLGCQHPHLLVDPAIAFSRCVGELCTGVRTALFDCVYGINERLGDLLNTPRPRHTRGDYYAPQVDDDDDDDGRGAAAGGERPRRGQRSRRGEIRLPPRGALRSSAGPFPGRVVLHHKLHRFQARLDEALRARREASRPPAMTPPAIMTTAAAPSDAEGVERREEGGSPPGTSAGGASERRDEIHAAGSAADAPATPGPAAADDAETHAHAQVEANVEAEVAGAASAPAADMQPDGERQSTATTPNAAQQS